MQEIVDTLLVLELLCLSIAKSNTNTKDKPLPIITGIQWFLLVSCGFLVLLLLLLPFWISLSADIHLLARKLTLCAIVILCFGKTFETWNRKYCVFTSVVSVVIVWIFT